MQIFSELKKQLPPLIAAVRASPTPPVSEWLLGDYDLKEQAALCDAMCKELGFDTGTGRLDVSVHPFTCGAQLSPQCPLEIKKFRISGSNVKNLDGII